MIDNLEGISGVNLKSWVITPSSREQILEWLEKK
jgi:hypothetical protein